jgi:hypothetical protein
MHVLLKAPLDDHQPGETVELLDHHAQNLIALGFAEPVAAAAKAGAKSASASPAAGGDA